MTKQTNPARSTCSARWTWRPNGYVSSRRSSIRPAKRSFPAPVDTGTYRSRVLSVHQTGDAAVAVVAEEGYWGSVSFVDYFSLARIDGGWKIVCKLFTHTGGEPPEGV